jgi:Glycosyl transferase family 11
MIATSPGHSAGTAVALSGGPLKAILVQLLGGLGNQMFQYAAARAVSVRCNAPLILDGSWLSSETQRHFALWPFRIKAEIIESTRFRSQLNLVCWRFAQRLNRRFGTHKLGAPVYREKSFRYDSGARSLEAPVYMYGYFQSEKYFAHCRDIIFEDFQISDQPRAEAQALLDRIQGSDAICLHIRRGDYSSDPTVNAFHGLCSLDYYRCGVQEVANNLTRPECFAFSDDPVWVRENLKLNVPTTIVDIHGPDEAHEDLRLMAACHSYVIANSSLSWWGAWLGRRAGKRVVAPRRWFQARRHDELDLIPDDWVRL